MPTIPHPGRLLGRRHPDPATTPEAPTALTAPLHADARGATLPASQRRFDAAFDLVRVAVMDGRLPSAVFGVRHGAVDARIEPMGRQGGDRVVRDSIYFLASITKPVMAVALMQLVEDGRIDLDRPLVEDLPEVAGADRRAVAPGDCGG